MKIDEQIAFTHIDASLRKHNDAPRLAATVNAQGGGEFNDKVVLSPKARELQDARTQLNTLPDVDMRRVTEIQQQVENNTYKIDGRQIAERMLRAMHRNIGW